LLSPVFNIYGDVKLVDGASRTGTFAAKTGAVEILCQLLTLLNKF
jgi:hypothetical protein